MSIFIDKHELAEKRDIPYQNLLLGTHDFSGDWMISNGGHFSKNNVGVEKDPNGNFAFLNNFNSWKGIGQILPFKKGEYVSLGAYIKINAGTDTGGGIYTSCTLVGSFISLESLILRINYKIATQSENDRVFQYSPNKATEWMWVQNTFQINKDGDYLLRFEKNTNNTTFEVSSMIISKTSEEIAWKPNTKDFAYKSSYDDLNARLTALESKMR